MNRSKWNGETDIDEFVRHAMLLHDGTRVYSFSKEMLAFLQTLVAFCPYYVDNDQNTAGPIDSYYAKALRNFRPRRRGGGQMSTKQMHRVRALSCA